MVLSLKPDAGVKLSELKFSSLGKFRNPFWIIAVLKLVLGIGGRTLGLTGQNFGLSFWSHGFLVLTVHS